MKKIKILIAGHTGFIGSSLVKELKKKSLFELVCLSRSNGFNLNEKIDLNGAIFDIVINLSAITNIDESWLNPSKYYKNNYLITLNLLEYARVCKAKFIQISSYTYGSPKYQPIDENHPINGYNPYASSKILADQLCESYSQQYDIPVTILKPFNIYGSDQSDRFFIKKMIKNAISGSGEKLKIQDLHAKRDYLWIDDFIDAIVKVAKAQEDGFFIYNIGSGVSYSAKEIIKIINLYTGGVTFDLTENPLSKLLIQDCICNSNLFSKKFNWHPKVDLKEGIEKMANMGV
jgi:nucleoside-diphosphate-sugar epimerase